MSSRSPAQQAYDDLVIRLADEAQGKRLYNPTQLSVSRADVATVLAKSPSLIEDAFCNLPSLYEIDLIRSLRHQADQGLAVVLTLALERVVLRELFIDVRAELRSRDEAQIDEDDFRTDRDRAADDAGVAVAGEI